MFGLLIWRFGSTGSQHSDIWILLWISSSTQQSTLSSVTPSADCLDSAVLPDVNGRSLGCFLHVIAAEVLQNVDVVSIKLSKALCAKRAQLDQWTTEKYPCRNQKSWLMRYLLTEYQFLLEEIPHLGDHPMIVSVGLLLKLLVVLPFLLKVVTIKEEVLACRIVQHLFIYMKLEWRLKLWSTIKQIAKFSFNNLSPTISGHILISPLLQQRVPMYLPIFLPHIFRGPTLSSIEFFRLFFYFSLE